MKARRRCVITTFTQAIGQTEEAMQDQLLFAATAVYWLCVKRGFAGVATGLGRCLYSPF